MNGLDLSAFLPPGALRVVHFGGDGTTRDRFLRIHPDCRYLQGGLDVPSAEPLIGMIGFSLTPDQSSTMVTTPMTSMGTTA